MSAEVRALIPEEEIERAHRGYGIREKERAVGAMVSLIEKDETPPEEVPLVAVWGGFAEMQPMAALDWLRKQAVAHRDRVPLEAVHQVWRAALRSNPLGALEWMERVPKKLRPDLTQEDISTLLQSTQQEVRLRGIRLSSQLGGADAAAARQDGNAPAERPHSPRSR
jgi:hypothetical protein